MVSVSLFEADNTAVITSKTGPVLKKLKATNLQNLKKLVKQELIDLGVNFQPEVRPRFTLEQKQVADQVVNTIAGRLIKDDLGPDASKTYKETLFEES